MFSLIYNFRNPEEKEEFEENGKIKIKNGRSSIFAW